MQDGHFVFIFTWNLSNADVGLDRNDRSMVELLDHNQIPMLYREIGIEAD
jgi:hypothetical protein